MSAETTANTDTDQTDQYYLDKLAGLDQYHATHPAKASLMLYYYNGLSLPARREKQGLGEQLYSQEIMSAVAQKDPVNAHYYSQRYEELTGKNYLAEQLLQALSQTEAQPDQVRHWRQYLSIIGMTLEDITKYCHNKAEEANQSGQPEIASFYSNSIDLL